MADTTVTDTPIDEALEAQNARARVMMRSSASRRNAAAQDAAVQAHNAKYGHLNGDDLKAMSPKEQLEYWRSAPQNDKKKFWESLSPEQSRAFVAEQMRDDLANAGNKARLMENGVERGIASTVALPGYIADGANWASGKVTGKSYDGSAGASIQNWMQGGMQSARNAAESATGINLTGEVRTKSDQIVADVGALAGGVAGGMGTGLLIRGAVKAVSGTGSTVVQTGARVEPTLSQQAASTTASTAARVEPVIDDGVSAIVKTGQQARAQAVQNSADAAERTTAEVIQKASQSSANTGAAGTRPAATPQGSNSAPMYATENPAATAAAPTGAPSATAPQTGASVTAPQTGANVSGNDTSLVGKFFDWRSSKKVLENKNISLVDKLYLVESNPSAVAKLYRDARINGMGKDSLSLLHSSKLRDDIKQQFIDLAHLQAKGGKLDRTYDRWAAIAGGWRDRPFHTAGQAGIELTASTLSTPGAILKWSNANRWKAVGIGLGVDYLTDGMIGDGIKLGADKGLDLAADAFGSEAIRDTGKAAIAGIGHVSRGAVAQVKDIGGKLYDVAEKHIGDDLRPMLADARREAGPVMGLIVGKMGSVGLTLATLPESFGLRSAHAADGAQPPQTPPDPARVNDLRKRVEEKARRIQEEGEEQYGIGPDGEQSAGSGRRTGSEIVRDAITKADKGVEELLNGDFLESFTTGGKPDFSKMMNFDKSGTFMRAAEKAYPPLKGLAEFFKEYPMVSSAFAMGLAYGAFDAHHRKGMTGTDMIKQGAAHAIAYGALAFSIRLLVGPQNEKNIMSWVGDILAKAPQAAAEKTRDIAGAVSQTTKEIVVGTTPADEAAKREADAAIQRAQESARRAQPAPAPN